MTLMRQPKIIVVDDSRSARAIIRKGFENAGYMVFDTDSAETAIDLILNERPDALLIDLTMPNLPTHDFIEQINELRRTKDLVIQVLLCSACSRTELMQFATQFGADGCVEKSQGISRCVAEVSAQIQNFAER